MTGPFTLTRPVRQTAPVVLNSPHSGRRYPAEFLAASRLDALAIRRSEDCFIEELWAAGPRLGMPLLAAEFPRAFCDVNREAWELDPAMFIEKLPDFVNAGSPRVAAGLGTIARVVGNNEAIYRGKMRFCEAQGRINNYWQPYHAALRGLVDETVQRFGACLLIDCHSMPSQASRPETAPQVILGDGHATTCGDAVTSFVQSAFAGMGHVVRRNDPYAGGYITRHYGRPRAGVQALQIEISRGLYMNERHFTKTADFGAMRDQLSGFLADLADASHDLLGLRTVPLPVAAE